MELRKFPVTAPSGNEYEVVIQRTALGIICFEVFERRAVRNLFGKKRFKRKEVATTSYWEHDITDVIPIVSRLVGEVEKRKEDDAKRAAAYEAFTHWDGHVDPKEAAK